MDDKGTIDLDATFEDHDVYESPTGDATVFEPGMLVEGLRIMRPLGRGGMGMVWVARDEALGRRVALKVLHTSTAHLGNSLLEEARTTAHFNHPHIVQIYATGVHRGAMWFSLELVDGGSLRQRIDDRPLAVLEGVRLLQEIAAALAHAHERGIVHQDLKPENVLIGIDGRARVADFGLARRFEMKTASRGGTNTTPASSADPPPRRICGTPPYMAPEQFRGEPPAPPFDIWAFGVLMWEVLRSDRPFDRVGDSRATIAERILHLTTAPVPADVPPELAMLVARCLNPDPSARPSAHALHQALSRHGRPTSKDGRGPPFRGLSRFTEAGAAGFFGRETEVALLVEQIRNQPILPLVGPSGTGKSSLVLGGLVPRLRERGPIWLVEVRPGRNPFQALAIGLQNKDSINRTAHTSQSVDGSPPAHPNRAPVSAGQLRADPFLLGRILRARAMALHRTAVLFVDQLEELLVGSDPETRLAYLRSLALAADDPVDPVRIILTLRDDFLGRLALDADIRRALSNFFVVQPPGPAGLRRILEAPVEARGYTWEDPSMVTQLIASTGGLVASLPLLQVAGTLLWERRDTRNQVIPRSALDEFGGLQGALAHHADTTLAGISVQEQTIQRQLLLRLVTPEETRRVVALSTLREAIGPEVDDALERLVTHRLVNLQRAENGDTDVELVHEALITHWHRLRRWLDEGRADHRLASDVEDAARRWDTQRRSPDACLAGTLLTEAVAAHSTRNLKLSPLASTFLKASVFHTEARARRQRLVIGSMVSLAGLLLLVLAVALWEHRQLLTTREIMLERVQEESDAAQRERDGATATLLAMQADEDSSVRKNTASVLRALAGYDLARTAGDANLLPVLWDKVLATSSRSIPMHQIGSPDPNLYVTYVALAPHSARVAIGSSSADTLEVVDLDTGATLARRSVCKPSLRGGAWSDDGTRLAHQCVDTFGVQIFDASGAPLQALSCGPTGVRPGDKRGMVAWKGGRLYVGNVDGICVYEGEPLQQIQTLPLEGQLARLSVSERWVAASVGNGRSDQSSTRIWDRATGALHLDLTGDPTFVREHSITDRFFVRRFRGPPEHLEVWALDQTPPRKVLNHEDPHRGWGGKGTFGPDQVTFWSPLKGKLRRWNTHDWSIDEHFERGLDQGHTPEVRASPDGRFLVEADWNGRLRVFDATSGALLYNDKSLHTRLRIVDFIDEDRLLAYTGPQGLVVWDLSTLPRDVLATPADLSDHRVTGERYWWLSTDGTLRTGTRKTVAPATLGQAPVTDPPIIRSASEQAVLVESANRWTFWPLGATKPAWTRAVPSDVLAATVSPDGETLAIRTTDGFLSVWGPQGRELTRQRIVAPGDLIIDDQNYGLIDTLLTTTVWSPTGRAVIGEQSLSGERWICEQHTGWACRTLMQQIRQAALTFNHDGTILTDRLIDHATENYILRRLDPTTGEPIWTWTDDSVQTSLTRIHVGRKRIAVASRSGRVWTVSHDGDLEHTVTFPDDEDSAFALALIDDDDRVAFVKTGAHGSLRIWDLAQQRLAQHAVGVLEEDWSYILHKTSDGARLWASIGDRALLPLEPPPTRSVEAVLSALLGQTNQRVCKGSLEVVSVRPYPDASTPWAPSDHCPTDGP